MWIKVIKILLICLLLHTSKSVLSCFFFFFSFSSQQQVICLSVLFRFDFFHKALQGRDEAPIRPLWFFTAHSGSISISPRPGQDSVVTLKIGVLRYTRGSRFSPWKSCPPTWGLWNTEAQMRQQVHQRNHGNGHRHFWSDVTKPWHTPAPNRVLSKSAGIGCAPLRPLVISA